MTTKIEFTRINNDTNGNPRYVCHFLNFITDADRAQLDALPLPDSIGYELALKRAKKIGGRKFHNKQYGGGIVFQSYNLPTLEADILELMEAEKRPNLAVYDNGGKTLDRFAIVDLDSKKIDNVYECINASHNPKFPTGVYLHGTCYRGRHLGKKIAFSQLPEELQAMVLSEYENND